MQSSQDLAVIEPLMMYGTWSAAFTMAARWRMSCVRETRLP
jgi:hypothetical protein